MPFLPIAPDEVLNKVLLYIEKQFIEYKLSLIQLNLNYFLMIFFDKLI